MSHIGSYDERVKNFSWEIAEKELDYQAGKMINIGWYCSDRICKLGKAGKTALIWEGMGGHERKLSYDDLRKTSNTVG